MEFYYMHCPKDDTMGVDTSIWQDVRILPAPFPAEDCIWLAAANAVPVDVPFRVLFLRAEGVVRRAAMAGNGQDTPVLFYEKLAQRLQTLLSAYFDIAVFLNLSYGDFCLATPHDAVQELLQAREKAEGYLSTFAEEQSASADMRAAEEEITALQTRILYRAQTQHLYKHSLHHSTNLETLRKILQVPCDSADKAYECTLLASLFLYTMLDEVRRRWIYANGELHYEEPEISNHYEASYDILIKNLYVFLRQADKDSPYSDYVWSFLFLTKALLAIFLGDSLLNADRKGIKPSFHNCFFMFLPIVSEYYDKVTSFFHNYFSPAFNYGFLMIPKKGIHNFWSMFPAYIHEFFHYIPTMYRGTRNSITIKLIVHAVLLPLRDELRSSDTALMEAYENIVNIIHGQLCEYAKFVDDNISSSDEEDSMYFLFKNQKLFSLIDMAQIYEMAVKQCDTSEKNRELFNRKEAECIHFWDTQASQYLISFTMSFREIRSDISMCNFLHISLEEYIAILASEVQWADNTGERTADSIIVRFGFMTRYLFFTQKCNKKYDTIAGFNTAWKSEVKAILNDLSQMVKKHAAGISVPFEEKIGRITTEKLTHMQSYIDEYEMAMIEQEDGRYVQQEHSLFEELIYDRIQSPDTDKENSLVFHWEQEIMPCFSHPLVKELQDFYAKYREENKKNDLNAMALMNYGARLIFRDLFMAYPDFKT